MALDNLRLATRDFHARLRSLGFRSYSGYLRSKQWAKTRKAWRSQKGNDRCFICKTDKRVLPHHVTYERLGHERVKDGWRGKADLVPLCSTCHNATHRLLDQWIRRQGDITARNNLSTAHIELRKSYRSLLRRQYREMTRA